MVIEKSPVERYALSDILADYAVQSLLEEVRLTPKPGLVDRDNNGSHFDLNLPLMELSARTLRATFREMAEAVKGGSPDQRAREVLASIGREGEKRMLSVTAGVNTHRGAIWSLGLITGAASILLSGAESTDLRTEDILHTVGTIASFEDQYIPVTVSNGEKVRRRYTVRSAREEAAEGFPALRDIALPSMKKYASQRTDIQRLNVLLTLMAVTDDTCILNRSDMEVLETVKQMSRSIIDQGGMGHKGNEEKFQDLNLFITKNWVSPGGSADLLAAAIYIRKITDNIKK